MSTNTKTVEAFLTALQNGEYDAPAPKTKVKPPVEMRADMVKAELSDTEGLGFKLEERQKDIMQLKTALKMKAEELSEAGVKVMRLEKKVAGAEEESARKVALEREETVKFREALNLQEMKFNKTIEILQGDIETLENEKIAAERKLDQEAQKAMRVDTTSTRRLRGSSFGNALGLREMRGGAEGAAGAQQPGVQQAPVDAAAASPLILARVDSLSKALSFSQHENLTLKAEIAKAQLSGLGTLVVPKRLLHRGKGDREGGKEGDSGELNLTDQEKAVTKDTTNLLQELNSMALPRVVDITNKDGPSPREILANQLASVLEMRRRKQQVVEEGQRLMASYHTGGVVATRVTSFPSPQFLKALGEGAPTSGPTVRLRLPAATQGGGAGGRVQSLSVSPAQLAALHSAVIG